MAGADRRSIGLAVWIATAAVVMLIATLVVGSAVYLVPPPNRTSISVGIYVVNLDGPPVRLSVGVSPDVVLQPGERINFKVDSPPNESAVYLDIREVATGKLYLHYELRKGEPSKEVIVRWPGFAYVDSGGAGSVG